MSDERADRTFDAPDVRWPVLALLIRHGRGFGHVAVAAAGLQLLVHLPGQASTALTGYVFDTVLQGDPFRLPVLSAFWSPATPEGDLFFAVAVFVGLIVSSQLLQWLQQLSWGAFAYRLQHEVRTTAYDTTQRLDLGFFDRHQTGEVMSVLNNDVNEMDEFFTETMGQAVEVVGFLLGVGLFMVLINWQFAVVVLSIAPVIALANYWFASVLERAHGYVRQSTGELNAQLQNTIGGIDVVKAYGAEDFEAEQVEAASREQADSVLDVVAVHAVHFPSIGLLTGAGLTVTFGVGGYWVLVGPPLFFTEPLTMGGLIAFLIYAQNIRWPMTEVAATIDGYKSATASARRILGLQEASDPLEEPADPVPLGDVEGRVEYDDVTFAYEGDPSPTLESVDVAVEPGETLGIVGPTGAGKSTLLKLLLRYYDPDAGSIRLDGQDLRDVSRGELRRSIGYVSQEPFLFSGTVRENLTYGLDAVDDGALREAAERAGALSFVEALPEGFDTVVGERGVKLSGGQRQRLAIARTALRDPPVLLMDEATSHVDNETEALIKRSLAPIVAERTTIVVAHRLSTVRDADRILVLEDGRVTEVGTHEELLDVAGTYATLWRVQAGETEAIADSITENDSSR